jgi:DNA-directed RNA polymerase subunit RPC12/RpoP
MRKLKCLRCQREMAFIKREKLQLGQTGMFLGDWPNILAGSLEVEIFGCANCGKLEFFMPGGDEREAEPDLDIDELPPEGMQNIVGVNMHGVPQVQCPNCGKRHDFDYPKCIYCDFDYYAK